ncbi:MAG: hypothetical protein A4E23_01259 [Methanomethylovorans sp. PtaU1.Bin073]|nr:MAG: hypothetical protein A4E23_01259 [Methanomethylovorans sp. PtaU1.Bin073]
MANMIVKVSVEFEVNEINKENAIVAAEEILEKSPLLCRWDVQSVTFFNGHPVDDDFDEEFTK